MEQLFTCIPQDIKKADILLIYPDFAKNSLGTASYPENQLGLNRLASYLDSKGYKVKVLNTTGLSEGVSGPEMLAEFLKGQTDDFGILGFHVNSWNISHIIRTMKELKDEMKDRLILFGGPLPTAEPEKILKLFEGLGFGNLGLVQGYGEFKLEEILCGAGDLSRIDGVWSLKNGILTKGSLQRLSGEQMATLPFLNPRYNTFYQLYFKPYIEGNCDKKRTTDIIYGAQGLDINHGCPFKCSYCSVHIFGHTVTEYTPEHVCDELEYLAAETGFFMFTFTNSNLMFIRKEWIVAFCEEILKRGMDHYLNWSGYHHPNTINLLSKEELKLMKRAGCDQIVVGVQSVEPAILKIFDRNEDTYKILKEIREKTAEADLELVIDYIRGVPGEDFAVIEEFYDYCVKNRIEVREFLLKIYPNTEIVKKGLDFCDYEVVPVTGELAPELDCHAIIPKKSDSRDSLCSRKINLSNDEIRRDRKIRIGRYHIEGKDQALRLKDRDIPSDQNIPSKVKTAIMKLLEVMLNPPEEAVPFANMNTSQMMKVLIMADDSAPPLVKNLQKKLRAELGEEKFTYLKKKYGA